MTIELSKKNYFESLSLSFSFDGVCYKHVMISFMLNIMHISPRAVCESSKIDILRDGKCCEEESERPREG